MTRKEVEDVYGLRLLLEPPSAAAAARAMTTAFAAALSEGNPTQAHDAMTHHLATARDRILSRF